MTIFNFFKILADAREMHGLDLLDCSCTLHAMRRLFIDHPLCLKERVWLSSAQSHYLLHVLRLKVGQSILIFNGKDGEWEALLSTVDGKKVCVEVGALVRIQPEERVTLTLFFAPLKAHRLEITLEKATELGVTALVPCLTTYTQIRRLNLERLVSISREAAEQSHRLTVPQISPFAPLQTHLAQQTPQQVIFFCDTRETLPYLGDQLLQHQRLIGEKRAVGVVIGPEGGWSPEERLLLQTLFPQIIPVQLGESVLRAETAALAALTLLQEGIRPLRVNQPSLLTTPKPPQALLPRES